MTQAYENLIKEAYAAFNRRDIDAVLAVMHPHVVWPRGWEGGYVHGHEEVRAYWTRQWQEVNPNVVPSAFREKQDGRIAVQVHQVVKDMKGNQMFDGMIKHVYTIQDGLIRKMEIEKE